MARLTIKAVNKAIAALGGKEELVKGDGYYYFWSEDAAGWPRSSVYVYRLNELPLDRWIGEWNLMKEEAEHGQSMRYVASGTGTIVSIKPKE